MVEDWRDAACLLPDRKPNTRSEGECVYESWSAHALQIHAFSCLQLQIFFRSQPLQTPMAHRRLLEKLNYTFYLLCVAEGLREWQLGVPSAPVEGAATAQHCTQLTQFFNISNKYVFSGQILTHLLQWWSQVVSRWLFCCRLYSWGVLPDKGRRNRYDKELIIFIDAWAVVLLRSAVNSKIWRDVVCVEGGGEKAGRGVNGRRINRKGKGAGVEKRVACLQGR